MSFVADGVAYVAYDNSFGPDELGLGAYQGDRLIGAFSPHDSELALSVVVREFIELDSDIRLCTHLPAEIRITEPLIEWFREAQWNELTDESGYPLFPGYREEMTDEEERAAYDAAFDKAIS